MAKMKYSPASIYVATPQTNWYLDRLVMRYIGTSPTDQYVILEPKDNYRPYNLAYELFGSKDYWWVFQVMNMDLIRDPIYDFKAGLRLRVPTKERLISNISAVR